MRNLYRSFVFGLVSILTVSTLARRVLLNVGAEHYFCGEIEGDELERIIDLYMNTR